MTENLCDEFGIYLNTAHTFVHIVRAGIWPGDQPAAASFLRYAGRSIEIAARTVQLYGQYLLIEEVFHFMFLYSTCKYYPAYM